MKDGKSKSRQLQPLQKLDRATVTYRKSDNGIMIATAGRRTGDQEIIKVDVRRSVRTAVQRLATGCLDGTWPSCI